MKRFMWLYEQWWLLPALVIIYCIAVAMIIKMSF